MELLQLQALPERLQELLRQATSAQLFDVNVESVSREKIK